MGSSVVPKGEKHTPFSSVLISSLDQGQVHGELAKLCMNKTGGGATLGSSILHAWQKMVGDPLPYAGRICSSCPFPVLYAIGHTIQLRYVPWYIPWTHAPVCPVAYTTVICRCPCPYTTVIKCRKVGCGTIGSEPWVCCLVFCCFAYIGVSNFEGKRKVAMFCYLRNLWPQGTRFWANDHNTDMHLSVSQSNDTTIAAKFRLFCHCACMRASIFWGTRKVANFRHSGVFFAKEGKCTLFFAVMQFGGSYKLFSTTRRNLPSFVILPLVGYQNWGGNEKWRNFPTLVIYHPTTGLLA